METLFFQQSSDDADLVDLVNKMDLFFAKSYTHVYLVRVTCRCFLRVQKYTFTTEKGYAPSKNCVDYRRSKAAKVRCHSSNQANKTP